MKRPPKYKTARRLGTGIYEKTQTQKYATRAANYNSQKTVKHPRQMTDYGKQMLEKQKVRYTYGVGEKQFARYVNEAVAKKGVDSVEKLYQTLETRLDNVVYRLGLAGTRAFARQMVSHGHITVNGRRVMIPSYGVIKGDIIRVREGSLKKPLFANLDAKLKEAPAIPNWLIYRAEKKDWEIGGVPRWSDKGVMLDLSAVLEFYTR